MDYGSILTLNEWYAWWRHRVSRFLRYSHSLIIYQAIFNQCRVHEKFSISVTLIWNYCKAGFHPRFWLIPQKSSWCRAVEITRCSIICPDGPNITPGGIYFQTMDSSPWGIRDQRPQVDGSIKQSDTTMSVITWAEVSGRKVLSGLRTNGQTIRPKVSMKHTSFC